MIDDRHITAFGQHLVPEAFSRPHTAHLVEQVEEVPHGADAFDRWRDRLVDACIADRYPAGHRPVRILIVEGSDGIRWRWDGDPCCPAEWLVSRVREEARPIPDPWVFAIELPWPEIRHEVIDPVTRELVALREPIWLDTRWCATWYAEARGRGVARTCAGLVDLEYVPSTDDDIVHGRYAFPVDTDEARDFHRILYGHPARRANPLRRA